VLSEVHFECEPGFNPKLLRGSRPNASLDIGASENSRRIRDRYVFLTVALRLNLFQFKSLWVIELSCHEAGMRSRGIELWNSSLAGHDYFV
jgi:hypothetical protein